MSGKTFADLTDQEFREAAEAEGINLDARAEPRRRERPDIMAIIEGHREKEELSRLYDAPTRPATDAGNAERIRDHFGEVLKRNHTRKAWTYWDGKRWAIDETGVALHLAKVTGRRIYTEAARADTEAERKALADWAKKTEAVTRIKAALELAESDPVLAVTESVFDQNPDIINTQSGPVDLTTGKLLEPDPEMMLSKITRASFDPELIRGDSDGVPRWVSAAPRFARFLVEISDGREDLIRYLQRIAGYSLTGHTREHKLFLWTGGGQNGKSVLSETLLYIAGEYAIAPKAEVVLEASKADASSPSPEIASLKGKRLAAMQETDDGGRLAEAAMKLLTGGDTLRGRFLFGNPVEFQPTHTAILSTNHPPKIRTGGKSVWRRLRVCPFDVEIPDEKVDTRLPEKLRSEADGILAWAIIGAAKWYREGLGDSETVTRATARYRTAEDSLAPFLAEKTVTGTGSTHRRDLYRAYVEHAEAEGDRAMSVRAFNEALRERGFTEVKDRVYGGITLRRDG